MSKLEDLKECNEYIKALFESEGAGKGKFVRSSYRRKPTLGRIVQIKKRTCKGEVVYDVAIHLCREETESSLSLIHISEPTRPCH
jgi:hypothetical protein